MTHKLGGDVNVTSPQESTQFTGRRTPAGAAKDGRTVPAPLPTPTRHRASPRGKHDTKVTVYLNAGELLSIDHALLELRRLYGLKVDRSTFVRHVLTTSSVRKVAGQLIEEGH